MTAGMGVGFAAPANAAQNQHAIHENSNNIIFPHAQLVPPNQLNAGGVACAMQQRNPAAMPSGPLARACDGDHAGAGVGSAPAHAMQLLFNSHDRSAQLATAAAGSHGLGANGGYAAPAQSVWGATYGAGGAAGGNSCDPSDSYVRTRVQSIESNAYMTPAGGHHGNALGGVTQSWPPATPRPTQRSRERELFASGLEGLALSGSGAAQGPSCSDRARRAITGRRITAPEREP